MAEKYPRNVIDALKEYYLNNEISLRELSKLSEELVGMYVPFDTGVHYYAHKEKWAIEKANAGRKTSDVPQQEKLQVIADKLYDMLVDEEDPMPKGQVAGLAKTYLDLVTRVNLSGSASNKVSAQAVKDMIAQNRAAKEDK